MLGSLKRVLKKTNRDYSIIENSNKNLEQIINIRRENRERLIKEAGLGEFDFENGSYRIDSIGVITYNDGSFNPMIACAGEGYVKIIYEKFRRDLNCYNSVKRNKYSFELFKLLKEKGVNLIEDPSREEILNSLERDIEHSKESIGIAEEIKRIFE